MEKYREARSAIQSRKESLTALNDYMATLIGVLDDLRPRESEREGSADYTNRVAVSKTSLRTKAALVRLSLN